MYDIEAAEERRKAREEKCTETRGLDLNETCVKCGLTHIIEFGHDCIPENLQFNLQNNYEKVKKESEGFSRKMKNTFFKRYRTHIKRKYGVTLK